MEILHFQHKHTQNFPIKTLNDIKNIFPYNIQDTQMDSCQVNNSYSPSSDLEGILRQQF